MMTICLNNIRTFLNFHESNIITEGVFCGDIVTPVTEITPDKDNIHTLHDMSNQYTSGIFGCQVKQINVPV